MTYQREREAIEAYLEAAWAGATPIGMDGHPFTPAFNTIRLTIQSGQVLQGSIGRVQNQKLHIGTATVTIYTDGDAGSQAWRGYAETLFNIFREKRLEADGSVATSGADVFLRFSPPQLAPNEHPYIGASFQDAPFTITNVIAPFVRLSYS